MVAHLVGDVYDECKNHVSNDVNHLAQSIQKVFQCTVKFTAIPAKTAKLLKLNIWNDFVLAVENSIESGKIIFFLVKYQCIVFIQQNLHTCGENQKNQKKV